MVSSKLEPLASIKNPKVYKTVKESISRFHSVLGCGVFPIENGFIQNDLFRYSILGNMHPTRTSLYKKWGNDKSKQGYGKYAKTNVNVFWAEVCTKAVHGKGDKYTKAAKDIIKKYKL